MTAQEAFTVLAINCGLQAADGVPVEHVQTMLNVISGGAQSDAA